MIWFGLLWFGLLKAHELLMGHLMPIFYKNQVSSSLCVCENYMQITRPNLYSFKSMADIKHSKNFLKIILDLKKQNVHYLCLRHTKFCLPIFSVFRKEITLIWVPYWQQIISNIDLLPFIHEKPRKQYVSKYITKWVCRYLTTWHNRNRLLYMLLVLIDFC